MTRLFYHLLTTSKTKRWLLMLDRLEDQTLTGNELAKVLGCTRRTVISDVKQIKESFQSTLFLLGDESGYLLELQNPVKYYQKKQALLENERLFHMVDTLFENKELSNQEWAEQLCLSSATFTRAKRQLSRTLQSEYGLRLDAAMNQLVGSETRIRQFFFDFYFTLSLYPKKLSEKISRMRASEIPALTTKWRLKRPQLQGWLTITDIRIKQGELLADVGQDPQLCHKLAKAFDPSGELDLPEREKAALFLAALDETQFLRPVLQTEFIYHFSTVSWRTLLTIEEEGNHVLLFHTLIQLMKKFFHLPYEFVQEKEDFQTADQNTEKKILTQMIEVFLKEKAQAEQSIFVIFRLVGSQALQRWIKEEVRFQFNELGYQLYEGETVFDGSSLPRIQVTNNPNSVRHTEICLSVLPTREEIGKQILNYRKQ